MATAMPAGPEAERTILGHPRGLFVLFFAEMWERFSYYGMRALLILYLTKHWLFSDGTANVIYGAYGSLVYITPLLGGYLADRYLGQRKAVLFGAILLTIGHGLMAVEGDGLGYANDPAINVFWLALAFIIVGSGFLKANISVIVGQLYERTDIRRDGAYTIFYIGINLGAFVGTLLAGWLGETYGWAYGFGAAGVGMLLGLIVFVIGKPALMGKGEAPDPAALKRPVMGVPLEYAIYLLGIVAIGVAWFLIQNRGVVQTILIVMGAGLLGYVLFQAFKLEKHPRERLFAVIFLIALQPVFWSLFEQAGGALNLYTDRHVDRMGLATTTFQSFNPAFIILLGPLFAAMWTKLGAMGREPSTPVKFALAIAQMGLAFLVLVWGGRAAGDALTPFIFIALFYLLSTTGELCLSPVGLSAMNRLSPPTMASLIMGAWFFSTAGGQFLAGKIGEATGSGGHGAAAGEMTKQGVHDVYSTIGWLTLGVALVVLLVSPIVKKWMHLDTLRDDGDDGDHPRQVEGHADATVPDGTVTGTAR